jgi:2-polyprenyl-3-methyl-5-hydroxy-6-metoxy-1,4-benzoquinol methylase
MIELGTERAREKTIANVRFEQRSLFDAELGRETYDVILAFNILHLLEDPRKAVQRAAELLKPRGILVSSTPCLGEAGVVLRNLLPLISKLGVLSYLRKLRIADLKDVKRVGGFEILDFDVRDESIPLCFVVARKR